MMVGITFSSVENWGMFLSRWMRSNGIAVAILIVIKTYVVYEEIINNTIDEFKLHDPNIADLRWHGGSCTRLEIARVSEQPAKHLKYW